MSTIIPIPEFQLADAEVVLNVRPARSEPIESDVSDPDTLADIRKRLDAGDTMAWCVVSVQVAWRGFTGADSIGGVALDPSTSGDLIAFANDHAMLENAVRSLDRAVTDAGWQATFPTAAERYEMRLQADQPVTSY